MSSSSAPSLTKFWTRSEKPESRETKMKECATFIVTVPSWVAITITAALFIMTILNVAVSWNRLRLRL